MMYAVCLGLLGGAGFAIVAVRSPEQLMAQPKELAPLAPNAAPVAPPNNAPNPNPLLAAFQDGKDPFVPPVAPPANALPKIQDGKDPFVPPMPTPVPPSGPEWFRLPYLCEVPKVVGGTPQPTAETVGKYGKFVKEMVDAEMTLDLVSGQTRLMVLKQIPKRIQIADDSVAAYTLLTGNEISLLGRNVGVTVLTLWFADPKDQSKQSILTYQVRVVPDVEAKQRLERIYKALADEINHAFPDSVVQLQLVGDKLVVSGHAKDVADATHILRIVRANAPLPFARLRGRGDAARIPLDPQKGVLGPGETPAAGPAPPGVENYELSDREHAIINLLRINGEQQVMLRVTVAEINRTAARSIGLNFGLLNKQGTNYFANNTGSIATGGVTLSGLATGAVAPALNLTGAGTGAAASGLNYLPSSFNNLPAALDNGQISLAISALRELNYARSLAEPNLVTMNGQTAQFQAGGQFPVPIVSGYTSYGLQGVSFVPYGVQLNFTPYITDRDQVRLVIAAEVSSLNVAAGSTSINGTSVPSLSTRNFKTTVELREGQTLAVAGLIQNNLSADGNRVPFLGDLPLIGRAFAFDSITAGEQELVILITPELVHPMNPREVPKLPGSDLFEPSDLEFYLLGRLESRRPVDFRSPVRTDWQRLREYRRVEQMYLSGPSGPSEGP
jgi:pilus assembly protein CpaC